MGVDAQMLVKNPNPLSDFEVRKIAVRISEAFYREPFFIWEDRHALSIVAEFEQDGDTIHPKKGEQFIEVNLSGRYYGEGYERGDLPTIIMIAEYLERAIPNCSIFYGGDSSGICAEPFDKEARDKLFDYFVTNGHTARRDRPCKKLSRPRYLSEAGRSFHHLPPKGAV